MRIPSRALTKEHNRVWRGNRTLDIETVEDARLEALTDVFLCLTSAAICETDFKVILDPQG